MPELNNKRGFRGTCSPKYYMQVKLNYKKELDYARRMD